MNKLKLSLEDLSVESFDTTPAALVKEGGTVFGQQCTCYTQCTCPGCPTCDASCNGTCGGTCEASCNGTCGPTCDVSCYGTCGVGTCGPTWDASCDTCDCTNEWGRC
jgi:hypothetical protein